MIRTFATSAVVFGIFLAEATPSISLTGSVTGTGQTGIAKAYVYLKSSPAVRTMADSSGAFQLSGNNAVIDAPIASRSTIPYIKNGLVNFFVEHSGTHVTCELTASNGARIFWVRQQTLASGGHSIVLPAMAPGIYFMRIGLGKKVYIKKTIAGMNTGSFPAAGRVTDMTNSGSVCAKRAVAANIDTLVVVAKTYKNAMIGITAYDQKNITVSLSPSNPWKPTGALIHENGMVKILANGYDFEMGQPDPNIWGDSTTEAEQPVHTVRFNHDFWMDTSEVTQKSYDSLMKVTYQDYGDSYAGWDSVFGKGNDFPAYAVSWTDAALYCNARSKRDHLDTVYRYNNFEGTAGQMSYSNSVTIDTSKNGYRMPTEAEWEYAQKAGGDNDYYWGKSYDYYRSIAHDSSEINSYATWSVNSHRLGSTNPLFGAHKACQNPPNAYGLYDMCGNVYEWCMDYFNYFEYGLTIDPVVLTGEYLGAPEYMAARGGSWGSGAGYLRASNRYWYQDAYSMGYWYKFMGIRVVRPIK